MRKKVLLTFLIMLVLAFVPILSACNEIVEDHTITVRSSSILSGVVHGDGIYKTETEVTLTAQELSGATFVAWIKNNMEVSQEKIYKFTAKKSTEGTYTAVFKSTNTTYYKASGISFQYNHLLTSQNLQDNTVRINGVTIKLTLANTTNQQTIYENSNLNLEVFAQQQTSDTLLIDTDYYMSRLNTFYLEIQIRYTANSVSGSVSKIALIDFNNLTYLNDSNANNYAVLTTNLTNSTLNSNAKISLHPAGVTAPTNVINW